MITNRYEAELRKHIDLQVELIYPASHLKLWSEVKFTYRIATPAVNQKFVWKFELRQVLCDQKLINVKTSALKHAII